MSNITISYTFGESEFKDICSTDVISTVIYCNNTGATGLNNNLCGDTGPTGLQGPTGSSLVSITTGSSNIIVCPSPITSSGTIDLSQNPSVTSLTCPTFNAPGTMTFTSESGQTDTTSLILTNVNGANGPVFTTTGVDLCDFAFVTSGSAQGNQNIRFEHRELYLQSKNIPTGEFQIGNPNYPNLIIGAGVTQITSKNLSLTSPTIYSTYPTNSPKYLLIGSDGIIGAGILTSSGIVAMGKITLSGGKATVNNSVVTTSSLIQLTNQSGNTGFPSISSLNIGSFTISSSNNTDSGVVAYTIGLAF